MSKGEAARETGDRGVRKLGRREGEESRSYSPGPPPIDAARRCAAVGWIGLSKHPPIAKSKGDARGDFRGERGLSPEAGWEEWSLS
jgi:hypothetical protein